VTRAHTTLLAGLDDPVHDAQCGFRAALDALARPGQPRQLGRAIPGLPLGPALSHLLLTLTDEDTPVWWQPCDDALAQWLRFHTGAPAAQRQQDAAFAVVTDPSALPPLEQFALGTPASPEFSTTLLIEVASLHTGPVLQWHGPGIAGRRSVTVAGVPSAFWQQWQANHAAFPQGVDVMFTCGHQALGLPRTTRIGRLEEV